MNRADHPRRHSAARPRTNAAQRRAQSALVELLNVTPVEVSDRGVTLRLTSGTTELPTWLDLLQVPYRSLTVRNRAPSRSGPLDLALLVEWPDFAVLARWAPAGAARIEAQYSPPERT